MGCSHSLLRTKNLPGAAKKSTWHRLQPCSISCSQPPLSSAIFLLFSIKSKDHGWLHQRRRERLSQNIDSKDRWTLLKTIRIVRRVVRLVPAILERWTSRPVEDLAKSGQSQNLMSPNILIWARWERLRREITTIAGTQVESLQGFGATPLILIRDGSTALCQSVRQLC